jgi:hypothetical protein
VKYLEKCLILEIICAHLSITSIPVKTFQTPRSSFLTWIEIFSWPLAVGRVSGCTKKGNSQRIHGVWGLNTSQTSHSFWDPMGFPLFRPLRPWWSVSRKLPSWKSLMLSLCFFDMIGLSDMMVNVVRLFRFLALSIRTIFLLSSDSINHLLLPRSRVAIRIWGRSIRQPKPAGGCIAYSDLSGNFQDILSSKWTSQAWTMNA